MVNTQYVLSMGILATTCESELAVASMCHAHFAYCSMLHFSQPRYRCKATSKECIAVRSLLENRRYNTIASSGLPVQNLTLLKFRTVHTLMANFCTDSSSLISLFKKGSQTWQQYSKIGHSRVKSRVRSNLTLPLTLTLMKIKATKRWRESYNYLRNLLKLPLLNDRRMKLKLTMVYKCLNGLMVMPAVSHSSWYLWSNDTISLHQPFSQLFILLRPQLCVLMEPGTFTTVSPFLLLNLLSIILFNVSRVYFTLAHAICPSYV